MTAFRKSYNSAKKISEEIEIIATDIQNIQRAAQDLHGDILSSNKELSGEAERLADISFESLKSYATGVGGRFPHSLKKY